MNNKFIELRNKYQAIIYKDYSINDMGDSLLIKYKFIIPELAEFNPTLEFSKQIIENKNIDGDLLNLMVFNIGMIELISYYKCVCPRKVVIEAGYLDIYQQKWFKKLYYNGLGEFLYRNNINISEDELFEFEILGKEIVLNNIQYTGEGNLIPVGGGKDSAVTLELLSKYKNNKCFIINPKTPSLKCVEIANYSTKDLCLVKRTIDKNLLELNKQGYLNGHTPFSSVVAFISYLIAYLTNKRYIVLSNENSANEPTIIDKNINHQYSKSYEFEQDFKNYTKKYFKIDIDYFSLLRPLKEIQIAMLFSKYKKYHSIFKSCNIGSKEKEWNWCCKCPKCLFIYIILSTFISENELTNIFGRNLLNDSELESNFLELIGQKETKPFECVGTISEVIYSLNKYIENNEELPYLVKLYKDNYYRNEQIDLKELDKNHNIIDEYLNILKEAIDNA